MSVKRVSGVENAAKQPTLSTKRETDWMRVLFQIQVNVSAIGAIHFLFHSYWLTIFYVLLRSIISYIGVAAGAHRLWAHRSYTAHGFLKFMLLIFQTSSGTGSVYDWVRWHRLHHKHFGTDLDPYNPSKGWLYAHVQSVALKLSPAQEKELETIDMSDIESEKMLMFQKKWYIPLYILWVIILPINAPAEYWGENLYNSFFLAGWLRYALVMHAAWLIHSATRIWGLKPGEKYPSDTNLVFILTKSHWLSYHYLAPWDYQTSEFGEYGTDLVSKFIRVCAALELATELKTISSDTVRTALTKSMDEKRHITECLKELCENNNNVPEDHYLEPSKHY